MRLLSITILVLIIKYFSVGVKAYELRRAVQDRKLEQGFDFVVSEANNRLCITAVEGATLSGLLELHPCDFENEPPEQLWRRDSTKFVSGLSSELCMRVNLGTDLLDGVRIRLGNCKDDLTDFGWNDQVSDYIHVLDNTNFCLTCSGSTAGSGDSIHAKLCLDRADYKWTFTAAASITSGTTSMATTMTPTLTTLTSSTTSRGDEMFGPLYKLFVPEANACIQPKNHEDYEAPIILDTCDTNRGWYVKVNMAGEVVFHSAIDPSLCLQAGFCQAVSGAWMRLMECDAEESRQYFTWPDFKANIKLADQDDLCMVFQGNSAEVGDIIIMKNCADRTYIWDGILT